MVTREEDYHKLAEGGTTSIPQRISMLVEHKKNIQNEIDRLLETQRIID
ncbi:hypothetical protein N007_14470 [Alicyclobacillus acidoterrestris ATCC 49025]|nr:hypothetical protein N007_14470 [Alicyclobacillus acidoterrestris ATCC 49025]